MTGSGWHRSLRECAYALRSSALGSLPVTLAVWIVLGVIASSAWVYFDAKRYDWTNDSPRSPGGWAGAVLLLWIVFFPLYLSHRRGAPLAGSREWEPVISQHAEPLRPEAMAQTRPPAAPVRRRPHTGWI